MPRSARSAKPNRLHPWPGYAAALALGMLAVAITFPSWALRGRLPPGAPCCADLAQQIVAQRYFLAEPWHLAVLHIDALMRPWGINLAFADGIPLAALIAKLLRPVLPPFDQVVTVWLALCWLLQPVAAVFALRSAGEKQVLPALCIGILASCQPVFLDRAHHATLSAHFTLLLLLGCYLRAVRGSRAAMWGGCALAASLVLVHPYLLFMGLAFPAAVCVTLLVRRDAAWRQAAAALAGTLCGILLVAVSLGLQNGGNAGVYGFHSMNLASLVYPVHSALFPGFSMAAEDATGGQAEGYAYLGAGLLLILAVIALRPGWLFPVLRRHAGLAAACAALAALALSNRVFLFHTLLFRLHVATGALNAFRASGRFIWAATYASLVGGVVVLLRGWPRLARIVLPAAALLAVLDGRAIWAGDRHAMTDPAPWLFDPQRMRLLLRAHDMLTVLPPNACTPGNDMGLMQPLWLAAETHLPTSTMYVARIAHRQSCDTVAALMRAPDAGELILVQPGFLAIAGLAPIAPFCRRIGTYAACTRNTAALTDLPALQPGPQGQNVLQGHTKA